MPNPSLAALIGAINSAPARMPADTRVVLIDGPAGSGKTTLANRIAVELGGQPSAGPGTYAPAPAAPANPPAPATQPPHVSPVQILHGDDMYEGWDGLDTLDQILLGNILEPLARGEHAEFRMWDWVKHQRTHVIPVRPGRYLLLEGVGVAQRAARPHASLTIYVDAPAQVRLERGIARDGEHMRAEWMRWQPVEAGHLTHHGTRAAADFIIDGSSAMSGDRE